MLTQWAAAWECHLLRHQYNMTKKILITEGLDFKDMEGQIEPTVSVDEYESKLGENKDLVTLAFTVKSKQVGEDLVDWFERGYDWIIDASLSEGEIEVGKYLVFVEMNRRSTVPGRILELISDLKTLTGMKPTEWTIQVEDEDYDADEDVLKQVIILNPNVYKDTKGQEEEEEINEMRHRAGLDTVKLHGEPDSELKAFISMAGL